MRNYYGYIYKLSYPDGKIYVGKKCSKTFQKWYFGSGVDCTRLKKLFGAENIVIEVLEWCDSQEELQEQELFWIQELHALDPTIGYNRNLVSSTGGEGVVMSDLHKSQNRKALTGITRSEETRALISKHHYDCSGKNNSMYGVHRCGKDNPNFGKKHPGLNKGRKMPPITEEYREQLRQRRRGHGNPMYGKTGVNNPNFGKIRVNDGIKNTTIREEDWEKFAQIGYVRGWIKYKK